MAVVVARGGASLSNGSIVRVTTPALDTLSGPTTRQVPQYPQVEPAAANTLAIVNNVGTQVLHLGSGVYTVEKVSGAAGTYDADAVSSSGMSGDFVLRIKSVVQNGNWLAGVNSDPLTDSSYTSLDYAMLFDGTWAVFESGVQIGSAFANSTYGWIWRTGTTLGYGTGATLATAQASPQRTVTTSATLYFDSSLHDIGTTIEALFYFPEMSGQSVVSAQGSATVGFSIALTGQAITAAQGQVLQGAPLVGQSVTTAQGSSTAGVAIALTGQSVTAARGSVTAVFSLAITGQSVSVAQGSATASSSFALTGQSLVVARGSVLAAPSIGLSGQAVTLAPGALTAALSFALSGQSVVSAQGSIVAALARAMSGQSVTASRGSLLATTSLIVAGNGISAVQGLASAALSTALTGQALISGRGSVDPGLACALSGADLAADLSAIAANDHAIGLTGVAALIAEGPILAHTILPEVRFWNPPPLTGRRRSVSRSH